MSIWCSHEDVGYEWRDTDRWAHLARGEVRSYADGWSNHFPTVNGEVEQPANVGLAHMPAWCVPGHRDDFGYNSLGPWLRLHVETAEHRAGEPTGKRVVHSVVMDERAARELAAELLAWADEPKVQAVDGAA